MQGSMVTRLRPCMTSEQPPTLCRTAAPYSCESYSYCSSSPRLNHTCWYSERKKLPSLPKNLSVSYATEQNLEHRGHGQSKNFQARKKNNVFWAFGPAWTTWLTRIIYRFGPEYNPRFINNIRDQTWTMLPNPRTRTLIAWGKLSACLERRIGIKQ